MNRWYRISVFMIVGLAALIAGLLIRAPLDQSHQKAETPFRLHFNALDQRGASMNSLVLLTLFVCFIIQGSIYLTCVRKLVGILSQNVPPRIKLKLLENEDHLFDAGLYVGFLGTIVSLILVSMGIIKFSLMAAYSSTSFGIVFVCIFKIFHLRPARGRLLLEAESSEPTPASTSAARPTTA